MYVDIVCPFGHEMSKRKTYKIFLSLEDRIDADLEFGKDPGPRPRLARFAVNYSARIEGSWREDVRYETFQGYLDRPRIGRHHVPEHVAGFDAVTASLY